MDGEIDPWRNGRNKTSTELVHFLSEANVQILSHTSLKPRCSARHVVVFPCVTSVCFLLLKVLLRLPRAYHQKIASVVTRYQVGDNSSDSGDMLLQRETRHNVGLKNIYVEV